MSTPGSDTTPATTALSTRWDVQVAAFAHATGKPIEFVNGKLQPLVGDPSDDAAGMLADTNIITDNDLHVALTGAEGIPIGLFRTHLHLLRSKPKISPASDAPLTASLDVLPSIPDDPSFVASLKVGGDLKVGSIEVLSAIKAGIAAALGLFDLPALIKDKMESYSEEQGEPVGKAYFDIQKLVTSRNYAEVLSALGVEGSFMSEKRKNAFLEKVNDRLWAALHGFHLMLAQWQESWQTGFSNPGVMMALLAGNVGGTAGVLPAGMMNPPETAGLHDAAEGFFEEMNKIFAGVGIPVARALAFDATRIKSVLENESLPATIGYINRDQMLKGLGVAVGSDYVRLERNLTKYAMAIIEFKNVTAPNQELGYLVAMFQLGATIPWDRLDKRKPGTVPGIGAGGRTPRGVL